MAIQGPHRTIIRWADLSFVVETGKWLAKWRSSVATSYSSASVRNSSVVCATPMSESASVAVESSILTVKILPLPGSLAAAWWAAS